jgi:uncharacterized RDD family membrane protein YckC
VEIIDNPNPQHFLYAGFWRRFVAAVIDALVLSIAFFVIKFLSGGNQHNVSIEMFDDLSPLGNSGSWRNNILYFLLNLIYYAALESSKYQATIGKMALEIRVIDTDGHRLSSQKAIVRYLGKIISAVILMIGYIMAAFDSKKQALHDKIATTYVIKN